MIRFYLIPYLELARICVHTRFNAFSSDYRRQSKIKDVISDSFGYFKYKFNAMIDRCQYKTNDFIFEMGKSGWLAQYNFLWFDLIYVKLLKFTDLFGRIWRRQLEIISH